MQDDGAAVQQRHAVKGLQLMFVETLEGAVWHPHGDQLRVIVAVDGFNASVERRAAARVVEAAMSYAGTFVGD